MNPARRSPPRQLVINPTEFEFVSQNKEIAVANEFTASPQRVLLGY
jgi:hypothetical protein